MKPILPSLSVLVLALVGCGSEASLGHSPTGNAPAGDSSDEDTEALEEELEETGECVEDADAFAGLDIRQTAMPTVFDVVWESPEENSSWVDFQVDAGELRIVESSSEGSRHIARVRGVPANHDVVFRIHDDQGHCSEVQTHRTGSLPSALPALTHDGSTAPELGFVTVPVITSQGNYLTVIDHHGRYVYAAESDELIWRGSFSGDGASLLAMHQGAGDTELGKIFRYDWTGSLLDVYEIEGLNSDFVEAPDGLFYALSWDVREMEHDGHTLRVVGNRLMSLDPASHEAREVWSVWDDWEPDLATFEPQTVWEHDIEAIDWSHLNGLSYDAQDDAVLISSGGLQGFISIDLTDEEPAWALGEMEGSLDWLSDGAAGVNPHSIHRKDDGELVVFNRMELGSRECSQVETLSLDLRSGTAERTSTYTSPDCLSVYFLGEAKPVGDGDTLINWTTSGRLERLDADGETMWTVQSAIGAGFSYSDHISAL